MAQPSNVEELLRNLISIDSTSTLPNRPVLDVIEPRLQAAGFKTNRQSWQDEQGVEKQNLIAVRGALKDGLALVGHTDCVPFDPAWGEALSGVERDGKIFGRGACDTKAFVAAAVVAAERTAGTSLRLPLSLIFTADEEVGCIGAKRLANWSQVPRAAHAIIGEPTGLAPVRANRGFCSADFTIDGQEGHSGYPETGASAIYAAAQLILRLDALRTEFSTLNVGLIEGGTARNIIPGRCFFNVVWRPAPGESPQQVLHLLAAAAREIETLGKGRLRIAIEPLFLDGAAETPADAAVVRFLEECSGKKSQVVPFGTELQELLALGAQACIFGPGDIQNAHKNGEYVARIDLDKTVEILSAAINHFCL